MNYTELAFTAPAPLADMLVAGLGEIGFESFSDDPDAEETEGLVSVLAYIKAEEYNAESAGEVMAGYEGQNIPFRTKHIEGQNWNEEWEKAFEPVTIAGTVWVRATFHAPNHELPHEIVIVPKMSFGTGHHATTSLMIAELLRLQPAGQATLDAGSGTGILAIMAAKLGANPIMAFDIDEWPVENARENFALNGIENVNLWQGTAEGIKTALETANSLSGQADTWQGPAQFSLILANINRNILLDEMPYYAEVCATGGYLLLSGFYTEDADTLEQRGAELGFVPVRRSNENNWCCALLQYMPSV